VVGAYPRTVHLGLQGCGGLPAEAAEWGVKLRRFSVGGYAYE
jgi:hypothetical protein